MSESFGILLPLATNFATSLAVVQDRIFIGPLKEVLMKLRHVVFAVVAAWAGSERFDGSRTPWPGPTIGD